jgi:hypothetical protein
LTWNDHRKGYLIRLERSNLLSSDELAHLCRSFGHARMSPLGAVDAAEAHCEPFVPSVQFNRVAIYHRGCAHEFGRDTRTAG